MILVILTLLGLNTASAKNVSYDVMSIIYHEAKKAGIDSNKLLRIAYVESRFDTKAVRVNKNGTTDIGLFQINSIHWNTTCKDLDVFTVKGNTRCAARLILMHKKHASTDSNWIGRYHSKTPSRKAKYVELLKNAPIETLAVRGN